MAFSKFSLVSYSDNDEFINGINFGLTRDHVKLIIEHFRNSGKWSEYYFHEIGDYSLTHTQLIDILNLRCIYWSDSDLEYFFSGWSVSKNDPLRMAYSNNNSLVIRRLCLRMNMKALYRFGAKYRIN